MFEGVKKYGAYMLTDWSDKHKKRSELARYPKIIADFKSDLVAIENKITEPKSNVTVTDQRIIVLKHNRSKEAKDMALLDEMIELKVMLNKDNKILIKEQKQLEQEEEETFAEVCCQVVEAEKLHNDKGEDKSTKGLVESLLADFRKGKKEANTTTNTSNNKSSSNHSALTDKVILVDNSDEDNSSVVSAITQTTITETLPCITTPVTKIADVDITMQSVVMKRYASIVGIPINNTIDNSTCNMNLLVEVEPEICTCFLDPDTKRLTKITSNKIQDKEIKVWNVATNLVLYKPDGDNSLNRSPLRYRPNVTASPAFKDSVKMTDQQTQLNQIYDAAKKKAQLVVNTGIESEQEHQEKEKLTIIQTNRKRILRSDLIMVVSLIETEMKVKDTLKKITKDRKNPLKNHYDQIVGFAWILLITGDANQALQEWAGIESATDLIVLLLTKQAIPARTVTTEIYTFRIGALYFKFPYKEVRTTAQWIVKDLSMTLIAGIYDPKKRMYDVLIFAKVRAQFKKWSMNTNIIDKNNRRPRIHSKLSQSRRQDNVLQDQESPCEGNHYSRPKKNTALENGTRKNHARVSCKARATNNEEEESEERTPTKNNKSINFKPPLQKPTKHQHNNNNNRPEYAYELRSTTKLRWTL